MNHLMKLANFSRKFQIDDVDERVLERAKLIILDSFAAIAFGNQHSEALALSERMSLQKNVLQEEHHGIIFGRNGQVDDKTAALINGIALVTDELDEGNPLAKGHPACHFLPGFFSLALREKVSGKDFLTAFITSYEISARFGAVITQRETIHPHGNWGVFGNGFGLGSLYRWEKSEDYIQAALLATSFSMPTLWQSVLEGHKVRNAIVGLNNLHTTLIPDLVAARFSASFLTPELLFNGVLTEHARMDELLEGLGESFYLMQSYFKFYSYCRFCHSPVDAINELISGVEIEQIKEIRVDTYEAAAKLSARHVNNEFAGKFSIPYAVASEICKRRDPKATGDELDEKIASLMKKIVVKEEKAFTSLLPNKRVTSVELELVDGRVKGKTVQRATGDPDEVDLHEKVITKSREMLTTIFGEKQTETLIEQLLSLDEQRDLSFFYELKQ